MRRLLRILGLVAVVVTFAAAAAFAWLAFTPSAAQWLVYQLVAAFDGRLEVGAVDGSLARGISIQDIRYRENGLRIDIDRAQAAWQWSALLDFHAQFRRLALGNVSVTTAPTTERAQLPTSLALPLRVSVDQGRIDRLAVASGAEPFVIEDIDFRAAGDDTRHTIDAVSVRVTQGQVKGQAQLDARPPFALQGQLTFAPAPDAGLPAASLTLSGTLAELHARFGADAPWIAVTGDAIVSPFEVVLVKRLVARIDKLVPHERFPESLRAVLHGGIDVRQVAEDRFEGKLQLQNDDPGEFAENKVPFVMLAAHVSGNVDRVDISALELRMPRGQTLAGEGSIASGAVALTLATPALDLKAWDKRLVTTRLSGSLKIHADTKAQSLQALLTQQDYRIEADLIRRGDALTVKHASATARGGSLALSGALALDAPYAFTAQARLQRFDPSAFFESPRARINADITAKGRIAPQWSAQLSVKADGSGPRGEPFTADARGVVGPHRVSDLQGRIAVGRNDLVVAGAYGAPTDSLAFEARLRALRELDQRFSGALDAKGKVSGDLAHPDVQFDASGTQLTAPGNVRIGTVQVRAALPSDWNKAIAFEASASDVQIDAHRANKVLATIQGTPRAHTIDASAQGKGIDGRLRLVGGMSSMRAWSGEIAQLEVVSPTRISMLAPARISIDPQRIEVGRFTVVAQEARVAFGQLVWTPDLLTTNGEFTQLRIAPFLGPWAKTLRSTLVLTGNWTLEQRGGVLRGDVNVNRDAGDIVLTADVELPLALTSLQLQARADNNRIRIGARATSSTLGELRATVATEAVRSDAGWALPATAPLAVEAQGDFSSIAWIGPLIAPGVALSGTLGVRASGQGTVGAPRIDGSIEARSMSIRMPATGVALTEGEVSARIVNDRVLLKTVRFKGGDGLLTLEGEASLRKDTTARLRLDAKRLMLVNRRDAQIEIDATGDVIMGKGEVRLKGDARITRGHLELLRKAGMPTLASDIRVKTDKPAPPPREPMRVLVDLSTDFGDRFTVTATGLGVGAESAFKTISGDFKARITGKLRTVSNANNVPQTSGQLHVIDGAYTAVGRNFRVQRGNLSFAGALNNPALDIFVAPAATRLQFTPEVGISITGTAQAPRVQVVSQPDMPETEKLSWLLFGRGGQNFDYAVGSTAGQIASPVTEFGWQLSQKLYVAYEESTTGTSNIVRIYSQLTDRVAIQAGTGGANSLFLLYTWTFN